MTDPKQLDMNSIGRDHILSQLQQASKEKLHENEDKFADLLFKAIDVISDETEMADKSIAEKLAEDNLENLQKQQAEAQKQDSSAGFYNPVTGMPQSPNHDEGLFH